MGKAGRTKATEATEATEAAAAPVGTLSFEQALDQLDELVRRMEAGDLPLEESIAAYRRGAELARYCQGKLEAADQQVSRLDGEILKPLDPADLRGGGQ